MRRSQLRPTSHARICALEGTRNTKNVAKGSLFNVEIYCYRNGVLFGDYLYLNILNITCGICAEVASQFGHPILTLSSNSRNSWETQNNVY